MAPRCRNRRLLKRLHFERYWAAYRKILKAKEPRRAFAHQPVADIVRQLDK